MSERAVWNLPGRRPTLEPANPRIALGPRQAAEHSGCPILAYRKRYHHRSPSESAETQHHRPRLLGILKESDLRLDGITRRLQLSRCLR